MGKLSSWDWKWTRPLPKLVSGYCCQSAWLSWWSSSNWPTGTGSPRSVISPYQWWSSSKKTRSTVSPGRLCCSDHKTNLNVNSCRTSEHIFSCIVHYSILFPTLKDHWTSGISNCFLSLYKSELMLNVFILSKKYIFVKNKSIWCFTDGFEWKYLFLGCFTVIRHRSCLALILNTPFTLKLFCKSLSKLKINNWIHDKYI